MSDIPKVGQIVHYQPSQGHPEYMHLRTGLPWPAIVTEATGNTGAVRLHIFTPAGQCEDYPDSKHPGLYEFAETPTPGHWNRPPS